MRLGRVIGFGLWPQAGTELAVSAALAWRYANDGPTRPGASFLARRAVRLAEYTDFTEQRWRPDQQAARQIVRITRACDSFMKTLNISGQTAAIPSDLADCLFTDRQFLARVYNQQRLHWLWAMSRLPSSSRTGGVSNDVSSR